VEAYIYKARGKAMFDVVNSFRKIGNEIQAQTMQTFLFIAMCENREIAMSSLAQRLGMSQASVSRNISYFMKTNRLHQAGPGFLETREDPKERRRKLVKLTNKGHMFYEELASFLLKKRS